MGKTVMAKYIRLSIEDSKTDSLSIENQRLFLDKAISDMNIDAEVLEFVDNGYSGTNFERPAVQELLELVRQGRVNCIVVKDFSRFGRNAIETGYYIERIFPLYGIRFIALSDCYDSLEHKGDTGGLEVAFSFLIHEQYSRDLSKKIKAAKQEKARRGESISKNCVFGYKKAGDRLEIDEPAAKTIRFIYELAAEGQSLTSIARKLYEQKCLNSSAYKKHNRGKSSEYDCVWTAAVIQSILHNEQYIGTYTAGKTVVIEVGTGKEKKLPESEWTKIPNHHPAIVDKALFDTVQEKLAQKNAPLRMRDIGTAERYKTLDNPLKGKVVCGICGHVMSLSTTKNAAFRCWFSRTAPDLSCYGSKIFRKSLQSTVLREIRHHMKELTADTPKTPANRDGLERQLDDCEDEKRALYEKFVRGELGREDYRTAKAGLDTKYESLIRMASAQAAEEDQLSAILQTREAVKALTASKKQKLTQPLVDLLIEKVQVFPGGQIEMLWK